MDRDALTQLLEQGVSVERIGQRFGKHPSTVSYWMDRYGLVAPNREKHAAKGGIARERLEELIDAGSTIAEIAAEVALSKTTVRHWLRRYGLRTHNRVGPRVGRQAREGKEAGRTTIVAACLTHGDTEYVLEGRGYYRCKRCRAERIVRHRRRLKELLVAEAGGGCSACGYDRCPTALEFHHVDPQTKRIQLSGHGMTLSLATLRAEAAKCVLLCSNCHAEVESGIRTLVVE